EDVGSVDRHLLRQSAALRVLPARPQVFVDAVDTLDHDLALLGQYAEDAGDGAALRTTGVVARNHFHQVIFTHVHDATFRPAYTPSAARLIIFMKLRSRSSRATAPKMRVPRGFCSLSMSTRALRSNLT